MTNTELILNMLAETATTDLSKERNPSGFAENAEVAKDGKCGKSCSQAIGKSAKTPCYIST